MSDYTIGRHEALIEQLIKGQDRMETTVTSMAVDISEIKGQVFERRVERKTVLKLAAALSAAIGFAVPVIISWIK